MNTIRPLLIACRQLACLLTLGLAAASASTSEPVFGPFHGLGRGAGPGHIEWFQGPPPTEPGDSWTITAWVKPLSTFVKPTLVAGFGDGVDYYGAQRFIAADSKGWFFWYGNCQPTRRNAFNKIIPESGVLPDRVLFQAEVKPHVWQHLAASFDGRTLRLFVDGTPVASEEIQLTRAAMQALIAPPMPWQYGGCFDGSVARFTIWRKALTRPEIMRAAQDPATFNRLTFIPAPAGDTPFYRANAKDYSWGRNRNVPRQDPDTLPTPVLPVKTKRVAKLPKRPVSLPDQAGEWVLNRGWEMADAWIVKASPEQISQPGFPTGSWYDATVPGTALTTLVQQGVYPDPLHGLNNMLIPDLSMKSWWYRVEFSTPAAWKDRHVGLTFKGINYRSEIWLNGRKLGHTAGAFIRGQFEVGPGLVAKGKNVLAVRVWPQPHYSRGGGEASLLAGAGANGNDGTLDGPTFFSSEGWDWIPTIRDRSTGIWQDVVLRPTGAVQIGDPQVVTRLPKLPDLSVAEVEVSSDLRNLTQQPQTVRVTTELAGARETKTVTLAPGAVGSVNFQLVLSKPRLWWPNGYGDPTLHDFHLRVVDAADRESDSVTQRVGLRQVDCEYLPPPVNNPTNNPLVIKVNGRRIYVRGGNWGMDDALKRSSVERLEPYFRLHRDAHFTMIRNWCGQSTQDSLYQLADKYGILVWNDFWLSTTGYNNPAVDGERFLANAEDTVKRFRNHASIALWCGRNEGDPPYWLNEPLAKLLATHDGSRLYIPKSTERKFLLKSGPWAYKDPSYYYETPHGFSTELGVNSIPTADAMRAMLDPQQLWPAKDQDAWAYHDFHTFIPGMRAYYVEAVEARYGIAQNFDDFIRRYQMLNYTHHRVMFEAWNANLWDSATGLLLWMSHCAWPSTVWQVYSHDYDTHASYYGAKKACEPVHVQWNLDNQTVSVINNPEAPLEKASVRIRVFGLDAAPLSENVVPVQVAPNAAAVVGKVAWADFAAQPVQFLKLELLDREGKLLSENFYWNSKKPQHLQALDTLPRVALTGTLRFSREGDETVATLELSNKTASVALMSHLCLREAATGNRILPAYASDNYLSLLPGESKTVTLRCGTPQAAKTMAVSVDGWNITPATFRENNL